MTSAGNIAAVLTLRPDYLGLIFHRQSPRNAFGLSPDDVLPFADRVKFAGVFVNRPDDEVIATARNYRLAAVQLHGDESPEYCRLLRDRGLTVWKAVGIETSGDIERLERYADCVDRVVFDRKSPSRGGTGQKFDWNLLDGYRLSVDFMLGGGISPDDAELIDGITHPRFAGIDLNSRFETSPGIKDARLLNNFLKKIKRL